MSKKEKVYWKLVPGRHQKKKIKDFIDFDYVHKLSNEEKQWLSKFTQEWYEAHFSKDPANDLHSKSARREIYSQNNRRQFDVTAQHTVDDEVLVESIPCDYRENEDLFITAIDLKYGNFLRENES